MLRNFVYPSLFSPAPASDFSATMQRLYYHPHRLRFPGPSRVPTPGVALHQPERSRRSHVRSGPSATVWKCCPGPTDTRRPLVSIGASVANHFSPQNSCQPKFFPSHPKRDTKKNFNYYCQ